jgi:hypothetical protein
VLASYSGISRCTDSNKVTGVQVGRLQLVSRPMVVVLILDPKGLQGSVA